MWSFAVSFASALFAQLLNCADTGIPCTDRSDKAAVLPNVLKVVSGIAVAISVLVIAIGGFRYTISSGDPQNIAKAKNTIIYALIGLVVALAAFSIVSFVLQRS